MISALCAVGSACAQDVPLPPGGLQALDGTYRGTSALAFGSEHCPETTPYALIVRNGQADGEVFSARDPTVVRTRFHVAIDSDGRIDQPIFVGGDEAAFSGRFVRDRFEGTLVTNDCRDLMTLVRVRE